MAEARHIAYIDDELFSRKLFNMNALTYYGGSSDVALVNEYLQSFSSDKQKKDEKLDELFTQAFDFVNNDANWQAISRLVDYILDCSKNIIYCEEIVLLLDQSIANFKERRAMARHHNYGNSNIFLREW